MSLVEKLFGSFSDRELKKINPIAKQVLALEEKYAAMPDADLQAQTAVFKQQLADGKTTDDILPDAFAVCREAAWRVLGMKHFPVQVIGGIALHRGDISEMQTGEGKTLVATLPAYLNALTGEGVHVVTVNDYLAKRDSEWMGKVYRFLGLSVGLIVHDLSPAERRAAYAADITYGTNNELGFDYLRDNMAIYKEEMVQRGHAFAIVDEVDSILIDEARTPLIISGKGEESSKLYEMADYFVARLKKQVFSTTDDKELQDQYDCDYVVDEKDRTVSLTQAGIKKAEEFVKVVPVTTAKEMFDEVTGRAAEQDIIIKAAAVADYRPKYISDEKVKKKGDNLSLELERTDDILAYLGMHKKEEQFLCGFSMETEHMLENSRGKLQKKNLDMIVANSLKVEGAGFGGDTNIVTIITKDRDEQLGKMSKEDTAAEILDRILSFREGQEKNDISD